MSLATRCTACGTIFRVVQDQLRVSEGWVRCGRCAEVFDAREQLFDIDREAPPPWPATSAASPAEPDPPLPPPPPEETATWVQPTETHAEPDTAAPAVEAPPPAQAASGARFEPQWVDEPHAEAAVEMGSGPDVVLSPHLAATPAATAELPSFMRPAGDSARRWRRPGVRIALASAAALLLALLGGQIALHFHDALAALYPQARPVLQALCKAGGCEIMPWRRIDVLSVETSALSQSPTNGAANQYQLSVSLHNKSGVEVATPWVELSLLDAAGSVVLRRMLAPTDFRTDKAAPASAIAAGADLPLQTMIATGAQRISGYTVEIFHP